MIKRITFAISQFSAKQQVAVLLIALLATGWAVAQIIQPQTAGGLLTASTISQAIAINPTSGPISFQVASVTGCPSFGSFNRVSNPCDALVDQEQMHVEAINGTFITVQRGANGTLAQQHVSGVPIYFGSPTAFAQFSTVKSDLFDATYTQFATFPPTVTVAQVTDVSGTEWFSQINVPQSTVSKGACQLNGNGTLADNMLFILWDRLGNVLANTAVAGVAQSGTSIYQCQNWVNAVSLQAGKYFVGVQGNGTTAASIAAYATGGAPTNYATGNQTGTFGTVVNITTVPATFSASKGPVMSLF